MNRTVFLTIVAPIAITVGLVALLFPSLLLESKGVSPDAPVKVWMTEVGILLISVGVIVFFVRKEQSSNSLKAIFIGNIMIQIGLLLIEIFAYANNTITEISGIIPNSLLHIILSFGFFYYLLKMNTELKLKAAKL